MKSVITIFLLVISCSIVQAQDNPVKIVFDVTSSDETVHQSAIRHAKNMAVAYPQSEFEVVVYSGAMNMVLKGKSSVQSDIEALSDNVRIVVCQGTMKRHNAQDSDLIEGVGTVPDGILEIISRQNEGWGYIKESN